jgi:hypothetical protein
MIEILLAVLHRDRHDQLAPTTKTHLVCSTMCTNRGYTHCHDSYTRLGTRHGSCSLFADTIIGFIAPCIEHRIYRTVHRTAVGADG